MARFGTATQLAGLLACLIVTALAAVIGGLGSAEAGTFYAQLDRPAWAPPGWLFSPVWTLLYLLMAIAAWQVWREQGLADAAWPLGLYAGQLAVNALWSWWFFAWQLGALAFVWILLLIILVLFTIGAFARVRVGAAGLLLPYLAWISFASALNFALWQRNPGLL